MSPSAQSSKCKEVWGLTFDFEVAMSIKRFYYLLL